MPHFAHIGATWVAIKVLEMAKRLAVATVFAEEFPNHGLERA